MAPPSSLADIAAEHVAHVERLFRTTRKLRIVSSRDLGGLLEASEANLREIRKLAVMSKAIGRSRRADMLWRRSHTERIALEHEWEREVQAMLASLFSQVNIEAAHRAAVEGWQTPPDDPDNGVILGEVNIMEGLRASVRKRFSKPRKGDYAAVEEWGGQRAALGKQALDSGRALVIRGTHGEPLAVAETYMEGGNRVVRTIASAPGETSHGVEMLRQLMESAKRDKAGLSITPANKAQADWFEKFGFARPPMAAAAATPEAAPGLGEMLMSPEMIAQFLLPQPFGFLPPSSAGVANALASSVNYAAWEQGAYSRYLGMALKTAEQAGQVSLEHLGLHKTFEFAHPQNMAQDLFGVRGSKIIQNAYGDHLEKLTKIITEATHPKRPLTIAQTTKRIREEWPALSKYQAERIARTETASVWTSTAANAYMANGIDEYESIVASGPSIQVDISGACDYCVEQGAFVHSLADDNLPPYHPNCRCDIIPNLEDSETGEPWLPPDEPWTGGGSAEGLGLKAAPEPGAPSSGPFSFANFLPPTSADRAAIREDVLSWSTAPTSGTGAALVAGRDEALDLVQTSQSLKVMQDATGRSVGVGSYESGYVLPSLPGRSVFRIRRIEAESGKRYPLVRSFAQDAYRSNFDFLAIDAGPIPKQMFNKLTTMGFEHPPGDASVLYLSRAKLPETFKFEAEAAPVAPVHEVPADAIGFDQALMEGETIYVPDALLQDLRGEGTGMLKEKINRAADMSGSWGTGYQGGYAGVADVRIASIEQADEFRALLQPRTGHYDIRISAGAKRTIAKLDEKFPPPKPKGVHFHEVKLDEFNAALRQSPYKEFVTEHTAEEVEENGTRMFLSDDGLVGFAVTKKGDAQNLFALPGAPKGAGQEGIKRAIEEGADHLDCYDGFLPGLYERYGFKATGKMKFVDEYAQEGWDYEKFGRPDVVFMSLRPAEGFETRVFEDWDRAKAWSKTLAKGGDHLEAEAQDFAAFALSKVSDGYSIAADATDAKTLRYIVSTAEHERVIETEVTLDDLATYYRDKIEVVNKGKGKLFFGGWRDPETGKTYLDVSTSFRSQPKAMEVGLKNEQLAIFDSKTFETISLVPEEKEISAKTLQRIQEMRLDGWPPPKGNTAWAIFGDKPSTKALYRSGGVWTAERAQLHMDIVSKAFIGKVKPPPGETPTVYLTAGGGASGKGSSIFNVGGKDYTLDELKAREDMIVVDPDALKELLPEYRKMVEAGDLYAAAGVHEESRALAKAIGQTAVKRGYNVVLDTTGSGSNFLGKMDYYKDAGYDLKVTMTSIPRNEAVERMIARGDKTGRFVPIRPFERAHRESSAAFTVWKDDPAVKEWRLYDNSGKKPVLVAEKKLGGKEKVYDPVQYKAIIAKKDEDALRLLPSLPPEHPPFMPKEPPVEGWAWEPGEVRFSGEPVKPPEHEAWLEDLKGAQRDAAEEWTKHSTVWWTDPQGGLKKYPGQAFGGAKTYADVYSERLDAMMRTTFGYKEPVTVWRGVTIPKPGEVGHAEFMGNPAALGHYLEEKYPVGSVLEPKGFQATSFYTDPALDASVVGKGALADQIGVIFEIKAKRGVYLGDISKFKDEAELLLSRNEQWRVLRVTKEQFAKGEAGEETVERYVIQVEQLEPMAAVEPLESEALVLATLSRSRAGELEAIRDEASSWASPYAKESIDGFIDKAQEATAGHEYGVLAVQDASTKQYEGVVGFDIWGNTSTLHIEGVATKSEGDLPTFLAGVRATAQHAEQLFPAGSDIEIAAGGFKDMPEFIQSLQARGFEWEDGLHGGSFSLPSSKYEEAFAGIKDLKAPDLPPDLPIPPSPHEPNVLKVPEEGMDEARIERLHAETDSWQKAPGSKADANELLDRLEQGEVGETRLIELRDEKGDLHGLVGISEDPSDTVAFGGLRTSDIALRSTADLDGAKQAISLAVNLARGHFENFVVQVEKVGIVPEARADLQVWLTERGMRKNMETGLYQGQVDDVAARMRWDEIKQPEFEKPMPTIEEVTPEPVLTPPAQAIHPGFEVKYTTPDGFEGTQWFATSVEAKDYAASIPMSATTKKPEILDLSKTPAMKPETQGVQLYQVHYATEDGKVISSIPMSADDAHDMVAALGEKGVPTKLTAEGEPAPALAEVKIEAPAPPPETPTFVPESKVYVATHADADMTTQMASDLHIKVSGWEDKTTASNIITQAAQPGSPYGLLESVHDGVLNGVGSYSWTTDLAKTQKMAFWPTTTQLDVDGSAFYNMLDSAIAMAESQNAGMALTLTRAQAQKIVDLKAPGLRSDKMADWIQNGSKAQAHYTEYFAPVPSTDKSILQLSDLKAAIKGKVKGDPGLPGPINPEFHAPKAVVERPAEPVKPKIPIFEEPSAIKPNAKPGEFDLHDSRPVTPGGVTKDSGTTALNKSLGEHRSQKGDSGMKQQVMNSLHDRLQKNPDWTGGAMLPRYRVQYMRNGEIQNRYYDTEEEALDYVRRANAGEYTDVTNAVAMEEPGETSVMTEAVQKAYGYRTSSYGQEGDKALISDLIHNWARTSSDADARGVALQIAAAEEFGLSTRAFAAETLGSGDMVRNQQIIDQANKLLDGLATFEGGVYREVGGVPKVRYNGLEQKADGTKGEFGQHVKEFDTVAEAEAWFEKAKAGEISGVDKAAVILDAGEALPAIRPALRAFARAQYEETQAYLTELGVEDVTIYRGLRLKEAGAGPSGLYREGAPVGIRDVPVGLNVIEVHDNPLASWSIRHATSRNSYFYGGTMLRASVPKEMIFSTPWTGFGCANEWEILVINRGDNMAWIAQNGEIHLTEEMRADLARKLEQKQALLKPKQERAEELRAMNDGRGPDYSSPERAEQYKLREEMYPVEREISDIENTLRSGSYRWSYDKETELKQHITEALVNDPSLAGKNIKPPGWTKPQWEKAQRLQTRLNEIEEKFGQMREEYAGQAAGETVESVIEDSELYAEKKKIEEELDALWEKAKEKVSGGGRAAASGPLAEAKKKVGSLKRKITARNKKIAGFRESFINEYTGNISGYAEPGKAWEAFLHMSNDEFSTTMQGASYYVRSAVERARRVQVEVNEITADLELAGLRVSVLEPKTANETIVLLEQKIAEAEKTYAAGEKEMADIMQRAGGVTYHLEGEDRQRYYALVRQKNRIDHELNQMRSHLEAGKNALAAEVEKRRAARYEVQLAKLRRRARLR